ncbi:Kinesin-like protein KIN-14A [Ancistrocladus abbreviatus]
MIWDSQPLPAYQYFENVGNFLVAVEELKLPAFEASDIETDPIKALSKILGSCLEEQLQHQSPEVS